MTMRLASLELIFLDIIKASQLKKVKDFVQEYQIQVPYKTLKNTEYAQQMGVKVTPEVLVTYNNHIQYQGAIDDWFIDWGKNRKQPEQFYLILYMIKCTCLLVHDAMFADGTRLIIQTI